MKYKFTVYIFAYIFITALISSCSRSKIIKTNGKIIKAIVLEVGVNSIKYKKCNDKHGRAYRIPKSSIYMIKYENGDSEVFNEKVKPEESNTSSVNQRKIMKIVYYLCLAFY